MTTSITDEEEIDYVQKQVVLILSKLKEEKK
jgi:hypothetical protein